MLETTKRRQLALSPQNTGIPVFQYLIIIEHFLRRVVHGGNGADGLPAEVDDRLPERLPGLVDERVRRAAAAEMRTDGEGRVEAARWERRRLQHAVEAVVVAVGELAPRLLVEGPLPLQRVARLVDDEPRQVQVDLRLRGHGDVRRHALHGRRVDQVIDLLLHQFRVGRDSGIE